MIQKHISLPEDLDQQIQERAKHLQQPEEQVITTLLKEGLKKPKQQWKMQGMHSAVFLSWVSEDQKI